MTYGHDPEAAVASLRGQGVRAIRLLYTDLHGVARGKDIPIGHFVELLDEGVAFCAAVMGTDLRHTPVVGGEEGYVDFAIRPDPGDAARRPVAAGGGVVPRRGLAPRRLRPLAVVPARAARPGRRPVCGPRPAADRRPRARVVPLRARPDGPGRSQALRRRVLARLHRRRDLGPPSGEPEDAPLGRRARPQGVRRRTTSS